jgi:protein phosphatase
LEVAGATHIGGRRANDDHYGFDAGLGVLAVADGVSSRPAGRIAAEAAVEALLSHVTDPLTPLADSPRLRVERAFAHVHRRFKEQAAAEEHLRGMATTLAFVLEHGDLLAIGHIGDSRVLRFRDGRIERLTTDHRLESDALARGRLTPEAVALHGPDSLTRGIGLWEDITPEVRVEALLPGDSVLLATDGLTDVVDEDTIAATLQRRRHPRAAVDALIQRALDLGAPDNVTCVYAQWQQFP